MTLHSSLSPSFLSPGASSISSTQKIRLHPYPHRESARISSVFQLSASLYCITLYQCLLRHGSVHTHHHCFADGVGSVLCFCHFIIWEAKSPLFCIFSIKNISCCKKKKRSNVVSSLKIHKNGGELLLCRSSGGRGHSKALLSVTAGVTCVSTECGPEDSGQERTPGLPDCCPR